MHQFHQPATNTQSQPGTAIPPRRAFVGLRERLEYGVDQLRPDTNSVIRHYEPYHRFAPWESVRFHRQGDLTRTIGRTMGKFDGIAQQIQQHLTQPHRITEKLLWHLRRNPHRKSNLLGSGAVLQKLRH